ncbi:MAG: oligosaccharide flippase family protein [Balneolaceae bacterium]|nr:oligosaccharide flippase family protein [Balneolaceae bacterium]MBO6546942.1 oligosaccharide flippase family protein [Balneolaceae bacterium]MBO6649302.1 oligosaccharide flippase family protein [Balneolaceae bacterium]
MTRKEKAVKSVAWSTTSAIAGGVLGPISYIFKARFLSPGEIGILAIILLVNGLVVQLLSAGFNQAIVERDKLDSESFSSLYLVNLFLSVMCTIAVIAGKDLIAFIFEMEELKTLLIIASFQYVLVGIGNPYKGLFQREINFKLLSIIDIVKALVLFLVTIILLFLEFKLYAIIYANLITAILGSLLQIYFGVRARIIPFKFIFRFSSIRSSIHFLKYYSGKLTSSYLTQNLDALIVGIFLPEYILGIYYFAKNLIDKFRMLLTNSLTSFLFPFFAEIKNDFDRIRNTYLKTIDLMSLISFFVSFLIISTADSFVAILFGEEWIDSIIVFQVLAGSMIFSLLTNNISTSLLYARGKVKLLFYIDILSNIFFLGALLFLSKLGLEYVLLIRFSFIAVTSIIIQNIANLNLEVSYKKLWSIFGNRLILNFILMCISFSIIEFLSVGTLIRGFIIVFMFFIVYFVYLFFMEKRSIEMVKGLMNRKSKAS